MCYFPLSPPRGFSGTVGSGFVVFFLKAESYSSITRLKRQYEKMKTNKGEEKERASMQPVLYFIFFYGCLVVWMWGCLFLLYYFCCLVPIERILFGVDALQIC